LLKFKKKKWFFIINFSLIWYNYSYKKIIEEKEC
jgi:hypothetical protein